jgi:hypothetical protein
VAVGVQDVSSGLIIGSTSKALQLLADLIDRPNRGQDGSMEVFRCHELGIELITPRLVRVSFRDMEIGELNCEKLRERCSDVIYEFIRSISTVKDGIGDDKPSN